MRARETAVPPGIHRAKRPLWLALSLGALGALLYLPTLGFDLVWDDPLILEHLQDRFQEGGITGLLSSEFRAADTPSGYFRPLTAMTLFLDSLAGGGRPPAFHATNIALHGLVCALAVLLLLRLTGSTRAAFWGGLLFATHPVHAETIAMAGNRSDLVAAVFVMLAALAWAAPGEGHPGPFRLAAGGGAAFLAFLSKETAFLLPPVLLGGALLLRPPRTWPRRDLPWVLPWSAAAAGAVSLRLLAGVGWGAGGAGREPLAALSLFPPLLSLDLKSLSLPLGLQPYYTPDQILLGPPVVLGILLIIALVLSALPWGLFALVWALGFLIPTLGLVPIGGSPFRSYYLFLPSFGFALAAGVWLDRLEGNRLGRWPARIGGLSLSLLFVLLAVSQARPWKDEETLFRKAVEKSPRFAVGHFNLGNAQRERGKLAQAEASYRSAIALDPAYAPAAGNLGALLVGEGRPSEAIPPLQLALQADPGNPARRLALSAALLTGRRWEEAARVLRVGLSLAPPDPGPFRYNLAVALEGMGRPEEAREEARRAREMDPSLPPWDRGPSP